MALGASPRSVQDARRWVVDACRDLGRDDLIDSAELAVSELVTNALLHAEPPFSVRVRGTRDHPRIEVADGSLTPPAPNVRMTDDDELLSTIGRGLGLVAMYSAAWGADIDRDGKIVWFVPAVEPSDEVDLDGAVFDVDAAIEDLERMPLTDPVTVRFDQFPVKVYADYRQHYRELRRELRLLALAHEARYPAAKELSELLAKFELELGLGDGGEELQAAIDAGRDSMAVTFLMRRTAPGVVVQVMELLELADAFCRAERLLSLATTPQQTRFQSWYLGEFVRQGHGDPPLPWSGGSRNDRLSNQNAS